MFTNSKRKDENKDLLEIINDNDFIDEMLEKDNNHIKLN
jgi:hypothetical protein